MYTDVIQRVRREAQETNVANKIIDMLDRLRLSANENSPRRWIWELLQNAKDVTNSSGKIKIIVRFDEEKGLLEFSHNGKPFTTTHLVYLIEQVSTKERNEGKIDVEKKSGKFGTGFLTTHLLSEKVAVTGILADDGAQLRSFNVHLDRSGKTKEEIIRAIQASYVELESSSLLSQLESFDANNYNTTFRYELNSEGIKVAKFGLEDLNVSIPYVLSLIPEIEELKIEPENIVYKNCEEVTCGLENSKVFKISRLHNAVSQNEFVLLLTEDEVTVAISLEQSGDIVKIKEYNSKQPRLFCDFPLVGTNDFPFPVIVDSSRFNPTEPRDGVFLTNNSNEKVEENKHIMQKACYLYKQLLEYASQRNWYGIYNIVSIKHYSSKDWFSKDWVDENVVNLCKEHIKYCPVIDTPTGKRIALYDVFDDEQGAFIIAATDEEGRNGIWSLANEVYPDAIPCQRDIHHWYSSFWNECRNLTLESLTKRLQEIGDIESLVSRLKSNSAEEWLNDYFALVFKNKKLWNAIKDGEYAVIPNQNGVFCKLNELCKDVDIEEEYKNILQLLDTDCKERLIYRGIHIEGLTQIQEYTNRDILNEIDAALGRADKETEQSVYLRILALYDNDHVINNKQVDVIRFLNEIYHTSTNLKHVKFISEKMQEDTIRYVTTMIADTVSEQQEMVVLEKLLSLNEGEDAITWLSNFIDYVNKSDNDHLLNRRTYPILPNQNGKFVSKENLFLDDEIDDVLKDLTLFAGYDVRNELLSQEVYMELPSNREKHNEDLVPYITQYAKDHYRQDRTQNDSLKNFFKTLFIWINEYPEKAQKLFPEICDNKYWLYDDKEIAINMKKAEAYDILLKKYNISSPDKLERILMQSNDEKSIETAKEALTEDLLIQIGIYSEEKLNNALGNAFFAENFTHESEHVDFKYEYVTQILERSKANILKYLQTKKEYDLNDIIEIDKTIFLIKKNGEELFVLARPSDYEQVILYYDSEKDVLDYDKDWELWVENGVDQPQKITFGKMLKLTGINKIPLRKVR